MYLSDFAPRDIVHEAFDGIKERTMTQLSANVDFSLTFINENTLRIFVRSAPADEGQWRYEVVITNRLYDLITGCFFILASCIPSVNGCDIPSATDFTDLPPFNPSTQNIEQRISEVSNEIEIDDQRIDLFFDFIREAWVLLIFHELAHITAGHLRFMESDRARWEANSAYSRACEYEADDLAAKWIMKRAVLNAPVWRRGAEIRENLTSPSPQFSCLVVSVLFLAVRVRTDVENDDYLPSEVRHLMMIMAIGNAVNWPSQEARIEETFHYMTEATRLLDMVVGMPPSDKPIIVTDFDPDYQEKIVEQVHQEYLALSHEWQGFAFRK
ncbi:hypothetical protein [Rhizobium viscosum]|uniref:Peptidase M48 domain-containing protein n=1 Tax=Rhizobium viscosum TaxID=1673 RepID=A0ABR9IUQ6_RHIVS|nr:hypothetical protein [Rhizobium viscosum]MBE1506916.1 hypothetical protein [Rhizobium viscosum]